MEYITAKEIKELMDSGEEFVLLDCRSQQAHENEHIVSSVSLPWKEIKSEEDVAEILPGKDALIISSCSSATCDASEKCYDRLEKLGYTNLKEYSGGLADWLAHDFETETAN